MKNLIVTAMLAASLFVASAANAEPLKMYAGAGVEHSAKSINGVDTNDNNGQLVLGLNLNQNVALEGNVTDADEGVNLGVDLIGSLPVTAKVDALALVGLSKNSDSDANMKPELGLGAQVHLTDKVNLRLLSKLQEVDAGDTASTSCHHHHSCSTSVTEGNGHEVNTSVGLTMAF